MIVVKLKSNLRIKQEDNTYRLFQTGTIFRAEKRSELPKWLQAELKYFEATAICDTLLVKEMTPKAVKTASDKEKEAADKKKADEEKEAAEKEAAEKKAAKEEADSKKTGVQGVEPKKPTPKKAPAKKETPKKAPATKTLKKRKK